MNILNLYVKYVFVNVLYQNIFSSIERSYSKKCDATFINQYRESKPFERQFSEEHNKDCQNANEKNDAFIDSHLTDESPLHIPGTVFVIWFFFFLATLLVKTTSNYETFQNGPFFLSFPLSLRERKKMRSNPVIFFQSSK